MLQLHAAGGGAERDGARGGADRQSTEARPAPAGGRQDDRVGPSQAAPRAEAESSASRAREGRRDTRHR